MRTVSAAFEAAIQSDPVKLCEIYQVDLASGVTYRYTDHDQDLVWDAGSNTYSAIPITRGRIRYNSDGAFNEVDLELAIQSLAVLNQIKYNILQAARITHKRIRWNASYASDEEILLGIWVPDPSFNRSGLRLRLVSHLDTLTAKVPAGSWQEPCNNMLFDPTCGLTQASYAYTSSATTGSRTTLTDSNAGTLFSVAFDAGDDTSPISRGDTITGSVNGYTAKVVQIVYLTASTGTIWFCEISNPANFLDDEILSSGGDQVTADGTPAEDSTFYEQGELKMTSGLNAGERRPVLSSSGSVRTTLWPFPQAIQTGDTYEIYPGCDLRPETCRDRFDNDPAWDGYPWVPAWEETAM
jgi:hypothetical protein